MQGDNKLLRCCLGNDWYQSLRVSSHGSAPIEWLLVDNLRSRHADETWRVLCRKARPASFSQATSLNQWNLHVFHSPLT